MCSCTITHSMWIISNRCSRLHKLTVKKKNQKFYRTKKFVSFLKKIFTFFLLGLVWGFFLHISEEAEIFFLREAFVSSIIWSYVIWSDCNCYEYNVLYYISTLDEVVGSVDSLEPVCFSFFILDLKVVVGNNLAGSWKN